MGVLKVAAARSAGLLLELLNTQLMNSIKARAPSRATESRDHDGTGRSMRR